MIIEERVCIHTHIYIYIYTYTYVYIHIHMYIYIYDYYMIIYMTSFEVSGVILFLVSYHIISFFFYVWELEEHDIRSIIDVCIM